MARTADIARQSAHAAGYREATVHLEQLLLRHGTDVQAVLAAMLRGARLREHAAATGAPYPTAAAE